ncbi:MAG: hypothetical protein ABH827_01025 [bacterium]
MLHNPNKTYHALGITLIILTTMCTTMCSKTYTTETTQTNVLQDQTNHQIQENTTLDTQQTIKLINKIVTQFKAVSESLIKKIKAANIEQQNYSNEDLEKLIEETLNIASFQDSAETPDIANLKNIHTALINNLKSYKVTGYSFAIVPNLALFYNSQKPEFVITYMDQNGNEKTRVYQTELNSIGLKYAATVNFDFMFFVNTDADFYTTNKKIIFGKGISFSANSPLFLTSLLGLTPRIRCDLSETQQSAILERGDSFDLLNEIIKHSKRTAWDKTYKVLDYLEITYVSFANMPGGMFMINILPPLLPHGNLLSIVTGGSLTPIN